MISPEGPIRLFPDSEPDIDQAFSVDSMDSLRRVQADRLYTDAIGPYQPQSTEALSRQASFYSDDIPAANRRYIEAQGLKSTDPKYDQYLALLNKYSLRNPNKFGPVDDVDVTPWEFNTAVDAAGNRLPSGRDLYERDLGVLLGSSDDRTDNTANSDISPATDVERIQELHDLVKEAQAEADAAYDARMKTGHFSFAKTRDKRDDELAQTMQSLTERTAEFDASYIEMMRQGGATEEQIAEAVAMGAKERNDERAKSQHDKVMGEGWRAKVHNTMKGYAELDTKKKILVGALGGAALAGVGVVAAAGGAFFATAGAVGLVGARAAKVYGTQRSNLYVETQPTEALDFKNDDGSLRTTDEILVEANTGMQEATVERINRAEKIKRNAAVAGGLAIGLAGVGTVFEHMNSVQEALYKVHSWFSGVPSGGPQNIEMQPSPQPEIPRPTTPAPVEVVPAQPAAFNISVGEGWYQTFGEIGIANPSEQAALLNNQSLMQELANRGLAYRDYSIGGWGINMTSNGQMPTEAVRLIRDYASQSGYMLAR